MTQAKENKAYFEIESINSYEIEKYDSLTKLVKEEELFDDLEEMDFNLDYVSKEGDRSSISFNTQFLPHCCGVCELGSLSRTVLPKNTMDNLFRHLFKTGYAFVINTIQTNTEWETYLESSSKFKKIKSFTNPNSNNTITIWISTN